MMQDRKGPDLGYRYPEPGTRDRIEAEDRRPSTETFNFLNTPSGVQKNGRRTETGVWGKTGPHRPRMRNSSRPPGLRRSGTLFAIKEDAGCMMQDTGCILRVCVFRRQVPGTGFQVPGTGFGIWPSVLGPRPGRRMREGRISVAPHPSMAEVWIPSTEDRTKPAHGVCILYPAS